jgi:hypothetical protein
MSSPIQFITLPQNQPYCTVDDIKALIGNVAPIANGDVDDTALQKAAQAATTYIEQACHRKFSPFRSVKQLDGNGHTRMVLPDSPIINVNQLNVYFTYPLALSRVANDWDLLIDRPAGILSFPTFNEQPFYAPFAYTFYKASRNVTIDAWYGYTRQMYSDVLTTTDHTTYAMTYPTGVKQSLTVIGDAGTPPSFTPTVYVNGVAQVNTTYALVNTNGPNVSNQWQIAADNLVYHLNTSANGITGITFNTPLQSTDVVTMDYAYWYIPEDIIDITAKRAAVTLLASFASATFADQQFQGASEIQADSSRIRYQNGGQWGEQIANWNAEVHAGIAQRKKVMLPFGIGYADGL